VKKKASGQEVGLQFFFTQQIFTKNILSHPDHSSVIAMGKKTVMAATSARLPNTTLKR
jgi:hypothetical protein